MPDQLLDVGAGHGSDSRWFAEQGARVTSYDYIVTGVARRRGRRAQRAGHQVDVRRLSLQEFRSVFAEGARVSRIPGERVILANHVLDATPAFGRQAFARFASMVLRDGGHVYADFWCGGGAKVEGDPSRPVPLDEVVALLENMGARIRSAHELEPDNEAGNGRRTGRVVAQWPSRT